MAAISADSGSASTHRRLGFFLQTWVFFFAGSASSSFLQTLSACLRRFRLSLFGQDSGFLVRFRLFLSVDLQLGHRAGAGKWDTERGLENRPEPGATNGTEEAGGNR